MLQTHNIRVHPGFFVKLNDSVMEVIQIRPGTLQPFCGADNSCVVPQGRPDRNPILVDKRRICLLLFLGVIPLMDITNSEFGHRIKMRSDVLSCPCPPNQTFQQRRGGQPIGSMKASTGYLSHRIQTAQGTSPPTVNQDSPTTIMCCWNDRDGFFCDINPIPKACLINMRKTLFYVDFCI